MLLVYTFHTGTCIPEVPLIVCLVPGAEGAARLDDEGPHVHVEPGVAGVVVAVPLQEATLWKGTGTIS